MRLEARAFAFVADQFDVGQELHLHRHRAVALAGFAAAAGNIEGKMARRVAALLRRPAWTANRSRIMSNALM